MHTQTNKNKHYYNPLSCRGYVYDDEMSFDITYSADSTYESRHHEYAINLDRMRGSTVLLQQKLQDF